MFGPGPLPRREANLTVQSLAWSNNTMRDQPAYYRLVLRSHLGSSWTASLPVVEFATTQDAQHAPVTCMTLRVADQSELIGLLLDLHAHNLIVESLKHLDRAS